MNIYFPSAYLSAHPFVYVNSAGKLAARSWLSALCFSLVTGHWRGRLSQPVTAMVIRLPVLPRERIQ